MQYDLIIEPVNPYGQYQASLGNEVIVASTREPLLAGARALLKMGAAPDSVITTRHRGALGWALRSTVGAAARLTVREVSNRSGLRFVPYVEFAASSLAHTSDEPEDDS